MSRRTHEVECTETTAPHLYTAGKRYPVQESFTSGGHLCHVFTNDKGVTDVCCPSLDTTKWMENPNEKAIPRHPLLLGACA
jgi:hypothetical protein